MKDYARIEKAIALMVSNATQQPSLATVAAQVQVSVYHLHRLFRRCVGVSPRCFLQALTMSRGKQLIASAQCLTDTATAQARGLSGSSWLYDHFVTLEAATPREFKREFKRELRREFGRELKRQGQGVEIAYGIHPTPFGEVLVATTPRGICRMSFLAATPEADLLAQLTADWPHCTLRHQPDATVHAVKALFEPQSTVASEALALHVRGTSFQLSVWRALLMIPNGQLASYSHIAQWIEAPTASRAVGNAIGANPVALWIPCHRVIQQSGALGGYRWGVEKKQMVQAWDAAKHAQRASLIVT